MCVCVCVCVCVCACALYMFLSTQCNQDERRESGSPHHAHQLLQIQRKYGGFVDMIMSGVVSRLLPTDSKNNADTTRFNLHR